MPGTLFADDLKLRLGPLRTDDLDIYIDGLAEMFAEVELLAREDDDGNPPWTQIMDLDAVTGEFALLWLAQLAGVRVPVGMAIEDARDFIALAESRRRGTIAYMVEIAQRHLTGAKTVFTIERVTNAYRLRFVTRTSETADPSAVEAALRAVKPAGIVLEYEAVDGVTWDEAVSTWAGVSGTMTWDDTSDEVP